MTTSLRLKKNKTSIGGGFIIGKNIGKLLRTFTYPYNDSIDFNTLPIQFACVATDVVDNSEIVIHNGVLREAMRASMSIPGAFSPVRKDGRVLVDGGLRNNYPADVAKEMGADYIIGVSVGSKQRTAEELNSTGDILLQIVDFNCKNKFDENMAITDIPILVNTEGYSTASFTKDGDTYSEMFKKKTMIGSSLSYYYNSPIGPIGLSLGYSNVTEKLYYYFNLGYVF